MGTSPIFFKAKPCLTVKPQRGEKSIYKEILPTSRVLYSTLCICFKSMRGGKIRTLVTHVDEFTMYAIPSRIPWQLGVGGIVA
jgi:hypothetical protein